MRKLTVLAGAAALIALSGCSYYGDGYYDRGGYYGGGYYGDGYYSGYDGGYYGPGYYDPYYDGADDWYYDGSTYFYYDRPSHRWTRRDHGPGRGQVGGHDHRGDRNWSREHDWHGDHNAPWNRPHATGATPPTDRQSFHRGYNSGPRGGVGAPRQLAPPPSPSQPASPPDRSDDSRGDRHAHNPR